MLDQIPRWKLINNHRSAPKEKSMISRSSRYNPARSNHSHLSENSQSGGMRIIAHNLSRDISEIPSHQNKETKSFFNYLEDSRQPRQSEGNFKGTLGSESLSGSKSAAKSHLQKKNQLTTKSSLNFQCIPFQKADEKEAIQNQFKHYLRFIENMERDFAKRKMAIQDVLGEKQEQINNTRATIIDYFCQRGAEIQDRELRKVLDSRVSEKGKSKKKQIFHLGLDRIQKSIFELAAAQIKSPEGKDLLGDWAKRKFGRIFSTLDEMKDNLNECQKIRGSKSPEKSNFLEAKRNFVEVNQLKVKSKKTHE